MKFFYFFDKTALYLAIEKENIEIVKLLLSKRPQCDLKEIGQAARNESKANQSINNSLGFGKLIAKSNENKDQTIGTAHISIPQINDQVEKKTSPQSMFSFQQSKTEPQTKNPMPTVKNPLTSNNPFNVFNRTAPIFVSNNVSNKSDQKLPTKNFKIYKESFSEKPSQHLSDTNKEKQSIPKNKDHSSHDDLGIQTTDLLMDISNSLSELRKAREIYESLIEDINLKQNSYQMQQFTYQYPFLSLQQQQQQQQQWCQMIQMNDAMQTQFSMNMMAQSQMDLNHSKKKRKRSGK